MPRQEQVHATPAHKDRKSSVTAEEAGRMAEEAGAAQAKAKAEHTTVADIDSVLDEIDSVLEENAADFVKAFVQKGGEAARVLLDMLARGFAVPWRVA